MTRGDVVDRRTGQPSIQLNGMHSRNAEHLFDPVRLQQLDQYFAARRHVSCSFFVLEKTIETAGCGTHNANVLILAMSWTHG